TVSVTGPAEPVRANITAVSRDFFTVLGTPPAQGRTLTTDDARPGAQPVAFVSQTFWRSHLQAGASRAAASPGGVGADLESIHRRCEGRDSAVAGVMPAGFDFPEKTDLWVPADLDPPNTSRTSHNFAAIGRLRDGVSVAAAGADLDSIARGIAAEATEKND